MLQLKGRAEDEARRLRGEIDAAKRRQGELMRRHREEAKRCVLGFVVCRMFLFFYFLLFFYFIFLCHRLCQERRAKELEAARLRRSESK